MAPLTVAGRPKAMPANFETPIAGQVPPPRGDLHLVVSLPALNEQATVGRVIAAIPTKIPGVSTIHVVVVDDGSTDRTARVAMEAGATVLHHERPGGVGRAFHTALAHALESGADVLVTIDADGQFNPADIPSLLRPVAGGEADFATASRFKDPALAPSMPWLKRWGNRQMSRLVSHLTGRRFHDVSCGMRCYNRCAMLNLNLFGRFTYTQEVFLNLAFKEMRIVEVPLAVRGQRAHGRSRVAANLWTYALNTSRILFRAYRDYHPMRFFGALAACLMLPATGLGVFLLAHYLETGAFTPHKWAGFTGAALFALGLMLLQMGMIGDMLNRHRVYLEELLYRHRRQAPPARTASVVRDRTA